MQEDSLTPATYAVEREGEEGRRREGGGEGKGRGEVKKVLASEILKACVPS